MNIPWKLKSFVFGCIDKLDRPNLLYFLQKHVTQRSKIDKLKIANSWVCHKKFLRDHKATGMVLEFGAGKNLAQNLFLSDVLDNQFVVDLNPMIDLETVDKCRDWLRRHVSLRSDHKICSLGDLASYGIEYKAPYDAANTHFDDETIDACISTNTLEHIPQANILSIFRELNRILKPGGVVSAKIDYSDHYAHTDKSISLLNYLFFSDSEWRKYNHRCHFQNRLRHSDYIEIFARAGFYVAQQSLDYDESCVPEELINKFGKTDGTWMATSGHLLLKKK